MGRFDGLGIEGDFKEVGFELNLVTEADEELITYVTLYRGDDEGNDDVRFRTKDDCRRRIIDYMIDMSVSEALDEDFEEPEIFSNDGLAIPRTGSIFHKHRFIILARMSIFGEPAELGYIYTHLFCTGPVILRPQEVYGYVEQVLRSKVEEHGPGVGLYISRPSGSG